MFGDVGIRKEASIYTNVAEISIFAEADQNQQRTGRYRYSQPHCS